jgi:hypothetical protein
VNSENGRAKGVGRSFDAWAARIYPGQLVVNNSTRYLRVLRSRMLCVISRIDDELSRRERGQHRGELVDIRVAREIAKAE